MKKYIGYVSLVLLLFQLNSCSTPKTEQIKASDENEKEPIDDTTYTVKAQFIEFALGDVEHYIFRQEDDGIIDFSGSESKNFKFARELPESEANEDNQGWGSNKSLQDRWFIVTYFKRQQPEYIDGPIVTDQIIRDVEILNVSEQPEMVADISSEDYTITALSLNGVKSNLPKFIDRNNADNAIIRRINEQILERFDLKSYDKQQDDFYWSGIRYEIDLTPELLIFQFNGDYIGAKVNMHSEKLIFDLSSGELIETISAADVVFDQLEYQSGLVIPLPDVPTEEICCLFTPTGGFKLYNSQGVRKGKIIGGSETDDGQFYSTKLIVGEVGSGGEKEVDIEFYKTVDYEEYALLFHERKDGMVKVLSPEEDWWIKEEDLVSDNFRIISWREFLMVNAGNMMGYYALDGTKLPVYAGPSYNAVTMMQIEGNVHEVEPTGEVNGNWSKVIVTIYDKHPCEEGTILESIEGWMELTTVEGVPLVMYYSGGC